MRCVRNIYKAAHMLRLSPAATGAHGPGRGEGIERFCIREVSIAMILFS